MLKVEQIKELEKRAGLSHDVLSKALSSTTEETLTFEADGEFISNTDLESIKEKSGKDKYAEGKTAGQEMLIKDIRTDEKLEFEGKSKENLVTALKTKYLKEAGKEPEKRITDLEADKKDLQKKLTDAEESLKTEKENYTSKLDGIENDNYLLSKLPEKLANGLTRDQATILFKALNKIEKRDGKMVLIDPNTKEVIKDRKLDPASVEDAIKIFVDSFGKINETGRTGKDETGKTKTNIEGLLKGSEVSLYFEKNNTPESEKSGILAKSMKNEGFDINA